MYWYHPDHLGSSSFITGIDGEVTQNIEYFPSGEVFLDNHLNSYNTPYLYNSKELDDETGYYYYGARYYNPRVSLWLNVDPLSEQFPGWSPYNYTFNNPIKYIDPTGMGPELPNLNAVRKIYSFNSNIFYSLYYSNNTSNKQLYEWANGNASSGKNKLKGAIGEAIAMDDIDGYTGALTGFIGWDDASFGKYYNGYQVDIQRVVKTGFKKLYADRGINVIYFANFNNFYGSSFTSEFGDGVKKQNFTFNYEVKTLSANTENTGNIYSNLVKGVDQTIKRTNLKNNVIGVLMVDKDAWLKVASDSTYGPKLKEQYDLMRKSGGQLQLNEGLNSRAEKALHSLGDKLKK